jgi:hypothetical protein
VLDRENLPGVILLALCTVAAGVLIFSIATGTRFVWTGPRWVSVVLAVLFTGATTWGFVRQPGRQWRWPWNRSKDER